MDYAHPTYTIDTLLQKETTRTFFTWCTPNVESHRCIFETNQQTKTNKRIKTVWIDIFTEFHFYRVSYCWHQRSIKKCLIGILLEPEVYCRCAWAQFPIFLHLGTSFKGINSWTTRQAIENGNPYKKKKKTTKKKTAQVQWGRQTPSFHRLLF